MKSIKEQYPINTFKGETQRELVDFINNLLKEKKFMKIIIEVYNDEDELIAQDSVNTFPSAEEALGKMERYVEKKKKEENNK